MTDISNLNFREIADSVLELIKYDPANPMIFSSGVFLFLFAGFALIYGLLRNRVMPRIIYVSLFSTYFYYKTGGIFFLLLLATATSDFFIGRGIAAASGRRCRKLLVALSVTANIGMLAYFKYTNLFIQIVNDIAGSNLLAFENIFLPVGISFFVFQSLSYTIDVYRGEIKPLRCWIDYFFYLSFFPQLVAGPIVRAKEFIPQIRRNPVIITRDMLGTGIFLVMVGLLKKAVISDYISLNFVDRIFDNPMLYNGFENLMGVYGYALQIYCDFSGYSDMAIGIALLLGFEFNQNFDSPYKSATITEFWRRWHISLSSWLKDYLYISLGGSRKGRIRTYINLLITMLLGGLWHGASLRFLLWGGFHGLLLVIHKIAIAIFPRQKKCGNEMKLIWRVAGMIITFNLVCLGWIFFRAPDAATVFEIIEQIFTNFGVELIPEVVAGYWEIFTLILFGYMLHFVPSRRQDGIRRRVVKNSLVMNALIMTVLVWVIMQVKSTDIQPFIYFQF